MSWRERGRKDEGCARGNNLVTIEGTVTSPHMNGKSVGGVKMRTSDGRLVAHRAVNTNLGGPIDIHSITQHKTSITATLSITPEIGKIHFKNIFVSCTCRLCVVTNTKH